MAKSDETSRPVSSQQPRAEWHDAWIAKLVTDPGAIPDVTIVTGFVGPAADADFIRVYLDPQLQQCLEIPADAIVHREQIPKTSSPLGGSHLWVLRNAMSRGKAFMRQG